jgi:7,8-dihydropterin-6-yl-methyl-4-(beta-D-ribofuranosyl)aminobenzene 5'-phosphate synthase
MKYAKVSVLLMVLISILAAGCVPANDPAEIVTLTIVYDDYAVDDSASDLELRTGFGFACVIETGEATVLFDTGLNGEILLDNMAKLGFDPQEIDVLVLSHAHNDHTGGMSGLLDAGAKPVVYAPASFAVFIDDERFTDVVSVTDPMEILPGIHTTGELGSFTREQALVVETEQGLVVVTGCAHPGIVEMVRRAKEAVDGDVALVMGGFHLGDASETQIDDIIAGFRELGVQQVAPSHCTGGLARSMFAEAFEDDCTLAGVGQQFVR